MARKLIKGVNDLETVNPELAKEWNYKKNYPLIPSEVLPNSNKKVWWLQEVEGIVFEWKASVNSRNHGTGNPYLSNQKVLVGYNDLATTNPNLAKEWNYEKNHPLTPKMVTEKSKKKVWWIQNVNGHSFEWESTIVNRSLGNGNPFLSGVKVWKGYNDLATVNPELAEQWDYEKNYPLTPYDITASSNKKVWWKYELDGNIFKWEATINNRNKNGGNPYLIGKKVKRGYNDLFTTHPKLAEQWDYAKNSPLTPYEVTVNSNKKVWWKQEVCGHIFSWKASISSRSSGCGNPYLSNKKIFIGYNDLATTHPELVEEWDYEQNKGLTPQMVTPHSPKRVFWIGKCGHKWKALIYNRVNGNGCPTCANEQQSSFPEQAIYYYIKKIYVDAVNRDKEVLDGKEIDVYIPSLKIGIEYDGPLHEKSVKRDRDKNMLCKDKGIKLIRVRDCRLNRMKNCICIMRDDDNDKTLENAIIKISDILKVDLDIDIQRDRVCILNQYISVQKDRSLASEYPELAKEWNYVKNKDITPDMVLSGSQKKVWWIQEINGIQFEWIASISHRVNGRGNPYTSNKKILKGYNDLATTHPKLAEEWNYNKNGNFSPNMIMAGSGKKVWWQKEVDGKLFEWEDSPNARTRRNGLLSYPREISSRLKKKNDV